MSLLVSHFVDKEKVVINFKDKMGNEFKRFCILEYYSIHSKVTLQSHVNIFKIMLQNLQGCIRLILFFLLYTIMHQRHLAFVEMWFINDM